MRAKNKKKKEVINLYNLFFLYQPSFSHNNFDKNYYKTTVIEYLDVTVLLDSLDLTILLEHLILTTNLKEGFGRNYRKLSGSATGNTNVKNLEFGN